MKAAGVWVFGGGLEEEAPVYAADATSGEVSVTDGPYVETKEWLGGFCVVSVADDEEGQDVGRKGRRGLRVAAGGTPLRVAAPCRLSRPADHVAPPGRPFAAIRPRLVGRHA